MEPIPTTHKKRYFKTFLVITAFVLFILYTYIAYLLITKQVNKTVVQNTPDFSTIPQEVTGPIPTQKMIAKIEVPAGEKTYINPTYQYFLIIPQDWKPKETGQNFVAFLPQAAGQPQINATIINGQFVQAGTTTKTTGGVTGNYNETTDASSHTITTQFPLNKGKQILEMKFITSGTNSTNTNIQQSFLAMIKSLDILY